MTTELLVVRHGETVFNRRGLYQGHADSPLTATGEAQARQLAPRLDAFGCSRTLYCSDLGRARRTANLLAGPAQGVREDAGLRERGYGAFEGLSRPAIAQRYPEEWAASLSGDPDYAPPGGETATELLERIVAAFDRIARDHADQRTVVVTHGGVVTAFARHVLGIPLNAPRRFDIGNTSLSLFYLDADRGWMVRFLGDMAHLEAAARRPRTR